MPALPPPAGIFRTAGRAAGGEGKLAKSVIIGGGVIGSSIAYHLAQAGDAGDVLVVEPDPTYEFAATPRHRRHPPALHGTRKYPHVAVWARNLRPVRDIDGGRRRARPDRLPSRRISLARLGQRGYRRADGELAGADRTRRAGRTAR